MQANKKDLLFLKDDKANITVAINKADDIKNVEHILQNNKLYTKVDPKLSSDG